MAGIAIPLRDWRAQGRTFDFNGHAIRYWEAGEGEPLTDQ